MLIKKSSVKATVLASGKNFYGQFLGIGIAYRNEKDRLLGG